MKVCQKEEENVKKNQFTYMQETGNLNLGESLSSKTCKHWQWLRLRQNGYKLHRIDKLTVIWSKVKTCLLGLKTSTSNCRKGRIEYCKGHNFTGQCQSAIEGKQFIKQTLSVVTSYLVLPAASVFFEEFDFSKSLKRRRQFTKKKCKNL